MKAGSGREAGSSIINNQKGSIMLEFVFVISIMLIIFMGSITVCLLFFDYYGAQKVAQEGITEASITGSDELGRKKAYQAAWLWGLDASRMTVQFLPVNMGGGTAVKTCVVGYKAQPL